MISYLTAEPVYETYHDPVPQGVVYGASRAPAGLGRPNRHKNGVFGHPIPS
jgi:hypothetical protein